MDIDEARRIMEETGVPELDAASLAEIKKIADLKRQVGIEPDMKSLEDQARLYMKQSPIQRIDELKAIKLERAGQ